MKRRTFLKSAGIGTAAVLAPRGIYLASHSTSRSDLETSFEFPPASARPFTWWQWMSCNVTKEGITLDLEAMKRIGLGGFQQFDLGRFIPPGPARYGQPEYLELKKHAIEEAACLGLDFEMHNCPGWSSSGGPWITPELSMQVLTWSEVQVEGGKQVDIRLSQPAAKNNYYRDVCVLAFPSQVAREATIDPNSVLNITRYLNTDGQLIWQVPIGLWTILHFGSTTNGALNKSAPEGGVGLECDKFSKASVEFHFYKVLENLISQLKPLAAKGRVGMLIDSYEVAKQDWTPAFPEEFEKRRGYDLITFLPAMTGRIMSSEEETKRFLWDVRRTQADLMAANYYGHFTVLCHKNGITAYTEPYGDGNFEEIQAGSRVDRPMGEMWLGYEDHRSAKLAASIAHVFGKKIVGAESFTSLPAQSHWKEYPFMLKSTSDWMFTQGINRITFHRFAHQPHPTARPGMTMGPWGIQFDRTNTWFERSGKWIEYLTRCQSMLQQGLFVADLLYFTGEDAPRETPVSARDLDPSPPEGYQWDVTNAEAVLSLSIDHGRIVLPSGASYRLLLIAENSSVTYRVLSKIRDLVRQGMILVGDRVDRSPSLADAKYAAEFTGIVDELWGDLRDSDKQGRVIGLGRVFQKQSLEQVLSVLNIAPDFDYTSRSGDAPINWIHRTIEGTEVYFLANRRRRADDIVATFRVNGKQPELWNPDSGEIRKLEIFQLVGERMRLPLQFDPAGSAFIVFRSQAPRSQFHAVEKDGRKLISTSPFATRVRGSYGHVQNNFSIAVWAKPEIDISIPEDLERLTREYHNFITYPAAGEKLYGAGHATCGLTAGRNGIVLFERSTSKPKAVLRVETPLAGWTHIVVTYREGLPSIYIGGKATQGGKRSANTVHPSLFEATQRDGAYYFIGHMTDAQIFENPLSDDEVKRLAEVSPPRRDDPRPVEITRYKQDGFLFWENG